MPPTARPGPAHPEHVSTEHVRTEHVRQEQPLAERVKVGQKEAPSASRPKPAAGKKARRREKRRDKEKGRLPGDALSLGEEGEGRRSVGSFTNLKKSEIRRAIVLNEVLGPPIGIRPPNLPAQE
jgi:hypothetical protein